MNNEATKSSDNETIICLGSKNDDQTKCMNNLLGLYHRKGNIFFWRTQYNKIKSCREICCIYLNRCVLGVDIFMRHYSARYINDAQLVDQLLRRILNNDIIKDGV